VQSVYPRRHVSLLGGVHTDATDHLFLYTDAGVLRMLTYFDKYILFLYT